MIMTRIAVIRKDRCNPVGCGDYLCVKLCPINRTGKECITKGEDNKPVISEELCTGCGICPNRCPFEAISIINLPEELTKQPIHQFGQNGFRLYSLPSPRFGKVLGILGKNGIGKSTAMKILAGILKPNLGTDDEEGYDKLIEFFKGTETQSFFEKLNAGEINVSYKPQNVDMIPTTTKGKVRELLEKVDEKKQLKEVAEELQITKVLDSKIDKISGGELQRVAIAATVLKKVNLYIFDEPTSYLDIKQRIRVSDFIRKLATEDTAVIVVEHDLIILDHMTDNVQIVYGKESCYGIFSQPKATRTGINVYLSGFLKEENIRFRDYEIKFLEKPPAKVKESIALTTWTEISKKLGNFELKAEPAGLSQNKVVGILGENGIGKTTFVKILAGEIEPDKGKVERTVSVSYKPQYLKSSNDLVMAVLGEAATKYEVELIRPLEIKPLMLKKLSELSGGELQRVSIALCLSKDADLYLLDEPSAYLDSEQRLIVSKVIRDKAYDSKKTMVVVDHDLLFIDYASDMLSVFSGEPAVSGDIKGPYIMEEGMNLFLEDLNITFRRDEESRRPRANKLDSQMDRKQKSEGKLYYI